jgi:hypothetical protein
MSNSIGDVLGKRRYDEPAELIVIRDFVRSKFDETPKLKVTSDSIIISVSNAALAGALRPHLYTLQEVSKTTKRLIIRIG